MKNKILILGGYGNFGKRIARALTRDGISVIIAGRNRDKADAFVATLPEALAVAACFDVFTDLDAQLNTLRPTVVINTCGPFQSSDYSVAECCIAHGIHYVDLADGREFVTKISTLDAAAKEHNVCVISGASSVPGLSSAVIEQYLHEFSDIDSITFGISPGQQAERGLATTQGILSYVGKPLKAIAGRKSPVYGWQDLYRQKYPVLGSRWMANCDIPDLDLFAQHYGIKKLHFSAGLELSVMHLGLWALSWMVRLGVPLKLEKYAQTLLRASNIFDRFGSADGGMHVILKGTNIAGTPHQRAWFLIALDGFGPHIPTIPAIVLAKKLIAAHTLDYGAQACVGLVTLDEYLEELQDYPISTYEDTFSAPEM